MRQCYAALHWLIVKCVWLIVLTELQSELESFVVRERIKIQDECSQQAVSKVIKPSCGNKDRVQRMIDSWTNAFLQVDLFTWLLFSEIYHSLIHYESLDTLLLS